MNVNRSEHSTIESLPAPIGGINSIDALTSMPATDATYLQNIFPQDSSVAVRNGCTFHNQISSSFVNTLCSYSGNTNNYLFAGYKLNNLSASGIYDITVAGVTTLVYSAIEPDFQWCQMGTIGGRFLMCFDGVNDAAYFDGTTWTATSMGGGVTQISGVDPKDIINCNIYKNRLYLVEKDTANVWYLPVNSIYGAAAKLDLSSILTNGSTIIAMTTWSIDDSNGLQEYAVFFSNNGEAIIYKGADPSVATDFMISSRFTIGKPLGYRCFERVGSDVFIFCEDGVVPLSKALSAGRSQENIALSYKIRSLLQDKIGVYKSISSASRTMYDCKLMHFPYGDKLIVNIGFRDGSGILQYVMNTNTGAWTIFSGWPSRDFLEFNSKLYISDSGASPNNSRVCQADDGNSDDGTKIVVTCRQSFQYLGTSRRKQFTAIRPTYV